jgi:uncharacterized protein YlxW (UPF0749 family)
MLDIALVSRHAGTVNRDAVCGLLAECLEYVSSVVFAMPYLVICCWVFSVSLFLYQAVKLTKVAETIIAEDSGAPLRKCIAELEAENSRLKDVAAESAETIDTLQRAVDNGVDDYNLLLEGNKSLLAERNDFHYRCEDLKDELAEAHYDAQKKTTDLESRVRAAEAAIGEK